MNDFASLLIALFSSTAIATENGAPTSEQSVGWVSLFSGELISGLENEDRMGTICAKDALKRLTDQECWRRAMLPKSHSVSLYDKPDLEGSRVGSLVVTAIPGKGLFVHYFGQGGGAGSSFLPHLFDSDWGYGPYFHHTVTERHGVWIRFSDGPSPADVWMSTNDFGKFVPLASFKEDVFASPFGEIVLIGVEVRT